MITEAEFAKIVADTKKVVLSAVSRTLPNDFYHAIDDVVQETYIRAYKSLVQGKFREESALSTWLYTIARNESLRMMKKLIREREKAEKARVKHEKKLQKMQDEEDKIDVTPLIDSLPKNQRETMHLYLAGKKEREIAQELGIAQGTVKSRLSRAKESLRAIKEAAL